MKKPKRKLSKKTLAGKKGGGIDLGKAVGYLDRTVADIATAGSNEIFQKP